MSTTIPVLPGLPALEWSRGPGKAEVDGGSLTLVAAAATDWTNDAGGDAPQHGATSLGFVPEGDFQLSAHVRVDGERTTYDAAVLAVWVDEDHWAKICFEFSPQRTAMVVSVVTNRWSDDVNSYDVVDDEVHLRVSRLGEAWAFHASADGIEWRFVRVFRPAVDASRAHVGFLSQSPMGERCVAVFDEIRFVPETLADLRGGA